jgi:asparagine synthase (glutamine-hydrolysing)
MTALAGVIGPHTQAKREHLVGEILGSQRLYGSARQASLALGDAVFGISSKSRTTTEPVCHDDRLLLVADIRLDNRTEIAARYGLHAAEVSDARLVLCAWSDLGPTCLDLLAGDFAFAVFDHASGKMTLCRDVSGQIPLHYSKRGDCTAFSSMPLGLRPFLPRWSVDRSVLAASLSLNREDDPRSNFEDIFQVLPGEMVTIDERRIERRIYWQPATYRDDPARGDLVEEYRHLLDTAVRDRLPHSAAPLATHLSSGWDSSSVTATASKLWGDTDDIVAFTSAPAADAPVPAAMRRFGDESVIASNTAAFLGVRHEIVRGMPAMSEVIRRQSALTQEPVIGVPNIAWLLEIRRKAAEIGATTLLSGENGNCTLNAGGLSVLQEWLVDGHPLTWLRQARLAARRHDTRLRGVLYNSARPWIPGFVDRLLQPFGSGPTRHTTFLRPEWLAAAERSTFPPPKVSNAYVSRARRILNSSVGMYRKAGLAGEGVEELDPFSDQRIIAFSLRLPPSQLYWNGESRPLARRALADRLPSEVLNLEERGLQGADWAMRFTARDAHHILDEIAASTTAVDLLDIDRMRAAIERWPVADWNNENDLAEFRLRLIGSLSGGMFALVHERGDETGSLS